MRGHMRWSTALCKAEFQVPCFPRTVILSPCSTVLLRQLMSEKQLDEQDDDDGEGGKAQFFLLLFRLPCRCTFYIDCCADAVELVCCTYIVLVNVFVYPTARVRACPVVCLFFSARAILCDRGTLSAPSTLYTDSAFFLLSGNLWARSAIWLLVLFEVACAGMVVKTILQ